MLKTFALALLATAMSVGLAQAKAHMHKHTIPGCAVASRRLRHAPVVPQLMAAHCCARRGNGATIPSQKSARSKAHNQTATLKGRIHCGPFVSVPKRTSSGSLAILRASSLQHPAYAGCTQGAVH
jgi:hypothetical protein